MLQTGLVSITFRKLQPSEIIRLVKEAGLNGIEWGGDVHVPHGDIPKAREVYKMTAGEGIDVAAYGSYYRVGCQDNVSEDFKTVLETAVELHAPVIRVWAGNKASKDADAAWWDKVVEESRLIADMAGKAGISVAYEYHKNTLTDSNETAVQLLNRINHDNLLTYWQPLAELDFKQRIRGLEMAKGKLANMHVFYWLSSGRRPLDEGAEDWLSYFRVVSDDRKHYAMLEFVLNDDEEQFLRDSRTLREMLQEQRSDKP